MRLLLASLLLLAGAVGSAPAEPPKVAATVAGKVGRMARLTIDVPDGKTLIVKPAFAQSADVVFDELVAPAKTRRVFLDTTIAGKYPVMLWYKGEDEDAVLTVFDITDPAPPTPTPTPTPGPAPGPTPTPDPPAPIPGDGLRVLFVYEKDTLASLPSGQVAALYSGEVTDYLMAKCARDNKTAEWRKWDQNQDVSRAPKLWQDAFARPRTSLPWLVISNGKTGFEGPLPATVADTLALLKKYGGN